MPGGSQMRQRARCWRRIPALAATASGITKAMMRDKGQADQRGSHSQKGATEGADAVTAWVDGFEDVLTKVLPSLTSSRPPVGCMPNERLRAALLQRGLTPATLGGQIGVDQKTVERWIAGRIPYRRHRYEVASRLGVDEVYLWPEALSRDQVTAASESEVLAIYPHRSDVPRDILGRLFSAAEQRDRRARLRRAVPGRGRDGAEDHRGQGPGRGPGPRPAR